MPHTTEIDALAIANLSADQQRSLRRIVRYEPDLLSGQDLEIDEGGTLVLPLYETAMLLIPRQGVPVATGWASADDCGPFAFLPDDANGLLPFWGSQHGPSFRHPLGEYDEEGCIIRPPESHPLAPLMMGG